MEMLLGYRVQGYPQEEGTGSVSDMFELRQAAIECAERLDAAGWGVVECHCVTDLDGQLQYSLVWPRHGPG